MNKLGGVFLAFTALVVVGCSDKSAMRFTIDSLTGYGTAVNAGKPYIECDLVGNFTSDCATIMDPVAVTVRLEKPGTIGPEYEAYVKNVVIDYYYYDPNDGQLKGPVGLLSAKQYNINLRVEAGATGTFTVPVASFLVKAWSQGVACSGVPGYSAGVIDRMVARVTVNAEDGTGKKLSAQGSIQLYLYNYGPAPTTGLSCNGLPSDTWLSYICP
jgi:hypothetical protein